jgi:hypothetical protein
MEPTINRRVESINQRLEINANQPGALVHYDTINWKAIFAGSFVSLLTYLAFFSLGLVIGSSSLENAALGTSSASGLGVGTGIWMIASIIVSIFAGSFASSRVGGAIPIRIGRVQGLVVAALFFVFVLSQIGSAVGLLGKGIGATVASVGGATGDLSKTPQVQDLIDQALGNLNLKSPPETVAQGVASRLVQGNPEGAKNYLARQAGITPQQADAQIQELKPKVENALRKSGAAAANTVKSIGLALFLSILLGSIAGSIGGSVGAAMNLRIPVSRSDEKASKTGRAA